MRTTYKTYPEFWKAYLGDHSSRGNRIAHHAGLALAILSIVLSIATGAPDWLFAALIFTFVPGWVGHLLFERTFPATIGHPFWSLLSDMRMLSLWCAGRLRGEINRSRPRKGPRSLGMYEAPPDAAGAGKRKARRR